MSKEMVAAVKKAPAEIEEEKLHAKVHGLISLKLSKETPLGKHGMAKCGICELIIETPYFKPNPSKKGTKK